MIKTLKTNDVDLVILNSAPPLLKFQAIHHGDLLFSRSDSQRIAFQIKAFNEYQDIRPLLAVQHAYLRKRLQRSIPQEGEPW